MACVKWSKCFNIFANKPWLQSALLTAMVLSLSACVSALVTGANIIYDRHHIYRKFNDFKLGADANRALFRDKVFKCPACSVEIAVFNQDILLLGHVPNATLKQLAGRRIQSIAGQQPLYNGLNYAEAGVSDLVLDSWITTKIRAQILADAEIDPNPFKIVTTAQVVYLLGNVDPTQAQKVLLFARSCRNVKRVVNLMRYYHLAAPAKEASS